MPHTTDFYVLRWANMPAILVESALHLEPAPTPRSSRTSTGRGRVARGIADGVDTWFASMPFRSTFPRISAVSQPTRRGRALPG